MRTGVRRRMGVEERRQQLIGVALDLFSRRSPDEVSIDEIASAAGISRPLVYHYFPGKLSLYEAALKRASDDLASRFVEPHEGPLGERLLRVMGRYFDFVDDHGPGFSALMRGGPAVCSSTTNALIDSVRQAAYDQIMSHLRVENPPARLELEVPADVCQQHRVAREGHRDGGEQIDPGGGLGRHRERQERIVGPLEGEGAGVAELLQAPRRRAGIARVRDHQAAVDLHRCLRARSRSVVDPGAGLWRGAGSGTPCPA